MVVGLAAENQVAPRGIAADVPGPASRAVATLRMSCFLISLGVEALSQAAEINQCALVNPAADFLCLVARSHCEDDSPAVYAGDDRFRRHPLSCRRRRKVPDVDDCAERGLAGRQVLANGV